MTFFQFQQTPDCVVYSIAFHKDIFFESEIMRRTKCRVYIFDPTLSREDAEDVKRHLGPRARFFQVSLLLQCFRDNHSSFR